jgi:hypothetical protein
MTGQSRMMFAFRLLPALLPIALIGASASAETSTPDRDTDPMRFFEGRTESLSTIRLMMRKPYRSRTLGDGRIDDGILHLVQRVHEDGKAPYDRRWRVRQVGPGRFTATMSEALGPVSVQQVGSRYRFRFRMKGNLAIEQWLIPQPDGNSARSKLSIRKFGVTVGRSEGTIRKLQS